MFYLTDDQWALRARARHLADSVFAPRAAEIDRTEAYPWDNVAALTEAGFMGMTIPKAYGGPGLTHLDALLVVEELARACGVTARIVVEANMGALGAIMRYGSEEQKKLAADLVLKGDKPAICITEPEAGSAATDMTTTALRRGDCWVLNGKKHWITGAGVSQLYLIFARAEDNGKPLGIAGFLAVLWEDDGLIIGRREKAMGLRGLPEAEVILDNLVVRDAMMLVPPGGIERGFAGLMKAYNAQRLGAAAVALGIAQGAYDLAVAHSKTRHQFGRPIAEFQGLQWMMADMSIGLSAARALIHQAALSGAKGFPDMRAAAEAKVLASETAIKVTTDALQMHGAVGYSRDLPLERMARDARMFTIGGGTAQVMRNQIAGAILDMKMPQSREGHARAAE